MASARRIAKRGIGLGALVALCLVAPASADKLQKYRYELSEFSGQSEIFTSHMANPCPVVDVAEGTLQGRFSSALNRIEGVKIGRSDAKGKITADADIADYVQDGQRTTDANPCGSDEPGTYTTSCARGVPTTPGIVGRFTDATKKKVEVEWEPSFDGVAGRLTPDFFCIPELGPLAMRTDPFGSGACTEQRYPRKIFEGDDQFELEVTCTVGYSPLVVPGGNGTYRGTYQAQLTLGAVDAG